MNLGLHTMATASRPVGAAASHADWRRANVLTSLASARQQVKLWRQRHKQRRQLAELIHEEHLLLDMGLTHAEVLAESQKPFWRA